MTSKVESEGSKLDVLKWLAAALIVAAGVVGNSIYAEESLFYRVVALIVLAGVAGFIALQTEKGQAFFSLFKESKAEIRKVVWPTRQETLQMTGVVVVVVLVMGLLLWGVDSLLSWMISGVIG